MTAANPFSRSGILRALADELDPPAERRASAKARYDDLGNYVAERAGTTEHRKVHVYPQGSAGIGTTTQHPDTGEFDVDLVISVEYGKSEISQRELNQKINGWLGSYAAIRKAAGGPLAPLSLLKGKRAWTLMYPDDFHIDVLPVLPDIEREIRATVGDPSWLTDKELRLWQPTNPKGFADWFLAASQRERLEKRLVAVEVDDLPYHSAKTSLQRLVQILKRHRDHMFRDTLDVAPPSVVITSLAGRAYRDETPTGGPIGEIAPIVVRTMPNYIESIAGEISIVNPTCASENYADRFESRPDKHKALADWLKAAHHDFRVVLTSEGMHNIAKSMDTTFGSNLGARVATQLGDQTTTARSTNGLTTGAAGALSVASETNRPHRNHTFYGKDET